MADSTDREFACQWSLLEEDTLSGVFHFVLVYLSDFWETAGEAVGGSSTTVHAQALLGPFGVVSDEIGVKVVLRLVDVLVEFGAAQDAEVLIDTNILSEL